MRTFPHSISHPTWCDPRTCVMQDDAHVDHRSAPLELLPASGDDAQLSVGLARFDLADLTTEPAPTVRLDLLPSWGDVESIGVDLTAADARLLAAALSCAADQLDAQGPALPKQRGSR